MATMTSRPERQIHLLETAGDSVVLGAAVVLVVGLALAALIQALHAWKQQNEASVLVTAVLFSAILAAVPGLYILARRRHAQPETAGVAFLTTMAVLLVAIYFFWVRWYVFFSADIWIWAEGEYVNDILKFSIGYPLYTAPANHDSFTYVPGSQLLTYLLAWVTGKNGSIPAYRVIQLCYVALAAFIATLCCRRIVRLSRPASPELLRWPWPVLWYAACFLVATNSITNGFAHNLHGDALALLVATASFYALLAYVESRSRVALAAMILLVPTGFAVRQSLLIWAVLYGGFLVVWDRSWKRVAVFAAATVALCGAIIAAGYLIWGAPFYYWVFYLMAHHPVLPLRSFQHVLDAWPYFAVGLLGGVVVLRGSVPGALRGAWLVSLALLAGEAYTSGIAWMLNHLGPGSLLACIWFLSGLTCLYESAVGAPGEPPTLERWFRAAAVTLVVALMFSGMGVVRVPLAPVSADTYRYVRDIEKQFEGQPPGKVLLDSGTWVYVKDRVVMGDRAAAIGEEGYASCGDFSVFRSHISARRYSKILVRNLHRPDFWYENALWPKPLGLRDLLLRNYREAGTIPAAEPPQDVKHRAEDPYLFGEITILEPRTDVSGQ